MDDIQSKIAQAKAAGYSDDEIAQKLATLPGYAPKFEQAKSAGYSAAEVLSHLSGAPAAPAGRGASAIPLDPGAEQAMAAEYAARPKAQPVSLMDRIKGGAEAAASIATGATAGTAGFISGAASGIANSIADGTFGTEAGLRSAKAEVDKRAAELTYQPRTEAGQQYVQAIGQAVQDSGLEGIPIPELNTLARGAAASKQAIGGLAQSSAAAMGAQDAAMAAGGGKLRDLVTARRAMAGGGAAVSDEATARAMRAADLPVPIDLTLGQKTRTFDQTRFERETAKLPKEGSRLRERFAEQNDKVFQNFDAFIDETGAQAPNLRATGEVVNNALIQKYNAKKAKINQQYKVAREAGDMAELVDVSPIRDYLEANRSAMRNAPVLSSVDDELNRLTGGDNMLSINDLEELRKMTGKLGKPNMANANAAYAPDVVKAIDAITEGKGGPAYQQARRSYENFAREFKGAGVIAKLLKTKPGTNDRAVAFEDILDHAVMGKGTSLDDVRNVRRTLQTAGPEGQQAWKELQGQALNQIKLKTFGNSARDELGNPIGSPAKLDAIINELDADGRLEFIFGKKGAEKLRDVNDLAKDIYTGPPGTVNTSNTASVLIGLMDTAVSGISGVPLPVGSAINYGVKRIKERALNNRVTEALQESTAQTRLQERVARQRSLQGIGQAQTVDEAIQAASGQ